MEDELSTMSLTEFVKTLNPETPESIRSTDKEIVKKGLTIAKGRSRPGSAGAKLTTDQNCLIPCTELEESLFSLLESN